jgi:hypothetical protein
MTEKSKPFSLALYRPRLVPDEKFRLVPVEFQIYTDNLDEHVDPVLAAVPTQTLDYGHLFTYCFRRFGFPNWGSDSYKDIAQWFLTTTHPELVLCIRPSVLPEPHFSIHFLTSPELGSAARNWERHDLEAWVERKLDWAEAQGLPDWMPEFLEAYRQRHWPGATWRDSYRGYIAMFIPREGEFQLSIAPKSKDEEEHRRIMTEFAAKVAEYEKIEPRPPFRKRSPDVTQWPSDDPLLPLAGAAIEALSDLSTGVRVRDAAINAYGVLPDSADVRVVAEPDVAGLGVADMINQAPQESVAIYQLARRLGNADVKEGLGRLIEIANAEGL